MNVYAWPPAVAAGDWRKGRSNGHVQISRPPKDCVRRPVCLDPVIFDSWWAKMGSLCKEIVTRAGPDDVWSAIRDIGALHTRLVPGFVTDTRLAPGARIVTFGNGMVLREPIVAVDDDARRLVWSAEGGPFTHYNASLQVFAECGGAARVVWIADFLPDEVADNQQAAMEAALRIMKATLDRLPRNE
jgi:Polyketide cyclase / dehydrase and lipid transport